jgi:hypothetical protein
LQLRSQFVIYYGGSKLTEDAYIHIVAAHDANNANPRQVGSILRVVRGVKSLINTVALSSYLTKKF